MIFGIPFLLGIATFFIFIFGGFSAIVGTHGGKELDPEGAEILFLASHPRYKQNETTSSAATDSAADITQPTDVAAEAKLAALLPLRRSQESDSEAAL